MNLNIPILKLLCLVIYGYSKFSFAQSSKLQTFQNPGENKVDASGYKQGLWIILLDKKRQKTKKNC